LTKSNELKTLFQCFTKLVLILLKIGKTIQVTQIVCHSFGKIIKSNKQVDRDQKLAELVQ